QQREGAKMHGNHSLGLEQLAGVGGFTRTHGKHVPYGQHRQVRLIELVNNVHVAKHIGVSCVINLESVSEVDHIAARLAPINNLAVILDPTGVVCMHHGHVDV